jgi:hypothetical protein
MQKSLFALGIKKGNKFCEFLSNAKFNQGIGIH